jgi:hypothetical protein
VLPVAAVARVAIAAGAVLRQVDEDRVAARGLTAPQPVRLAQPDQVGEREAGLGRDPVLQSRLVAGDVQVPAPAAAVIGEPRAGARVAEQAIDQFGQVLGLLGLPHGPQPGPQCQHGVQGGRADRRARLDQVLVKERLEGRDVGQVVGVDQVRGEHQGGGRVMSEKHVDS